MKKVVFISVLAVAAMFGCKHEVITPDNPKTKELKSFKIVQITWYFNEQDIFAFGDGNITKVFFALSDEDLNQFSVSPTYDLVYINKSRQSFFDLSLTCGQLINMKRKC